MSPSDAPSHRDASDEAITLHVTRDQAWVIYDLLVSRAIMIEGNEHLGRCDLGSAKYRRAADDLRAALGMH